MDKKTIGTIISEKERRKANTFSHIKRKYLLKRGIRKIRKHV